MAQRGINKVILIGNLGQDPEIRHTQAGAAIANASVATSEVWKDKNTGQPQERTEWHRVVFFNKLAEIVQQYVHKGSKIYIEGSLRTRKWQDKSGQDRYTTEIVADQMQMLDSKQGGQQNNQGYQQSQGQQPAPQQNQGQQGGYQHQSNPSGQHQHNPNYAPNAGNQGGQQGSQPPTDQGGFDDDIPF